MCDLGKTGQFVFQVGVQDPGAYINAQAGNEFGVPCVLKMDLAVD